MPENGMIHWTEDEDLLAEYVLGRLSGPELARLEAHLSGCDKCRESVRREQELTAGVRLRGREELKKRLQKEIEGRIVESRSFVTWQRALSAAAVVVIIAGVGIYYRWFVPPEQTLFSATQGNQEAVGGKPAPGTRTTDREGERAPQTTPKLDLDRGGTIQKKELQPLHRKREQESSNLERPDIAETRQASAPGGQTENAAQSGTKTVTSNALDAKDFKAETIASAGGYWAEGVILPPLKEQRSDQAYSDQTLSKPLRLSEPKQKSQTQTLSRSHSTGPKQLVEISQQTLSSLPSAKKRPADTESAPIQTMFRRFGKRVDIVLFPSSLFTQAELQGATFERAASDSLVVVIGDTRIGYRIAKDFLDSLLGVVDKQ